jgi:hypothetical protein
LSLSRKFGALFLALILAAYAGAETLTGTVTNATTGKPAAGDDVILIKLGNGMEEAARTKADAKGNFSFNYDDQGPHLIRAVHQGVTYHRMAPPGTTSVEVQVNDVAKKVDGISLTADVMRFQVEQGQLEVMRLFAVNNTSKPPKTQMNDHNFEFYLPGGAKVVQATATTAGGNPLSTNPVPQGEKNRYAFLFPLRPGETRFEVAYALPYSGSISIDPKSVYTMQHFVVMLPKSMQFQASSGTQFQSMNDPQQPDAIVQVVSLPQPGQPLGFKLSGEGMLAASTGGGANQGGGGGGSMGAQSAESRPGGGLGPPIDAPDPLQKYRWYIIFGFAAALAVGAVYVARRQRSALAVADVGPVTDFEVAQPPLPPAAQRVPHVTPLPARVVAPPPSSAPVTATAAPAARSSSSMLLEALKEEIFQLEVEHKQGKISQQDYEKTKAALDGTLAHAIKREAQKT